MLGDDGWFGGMAMAPVDGGSGAGGGTTGMGIAGTEGNEGPEPTMGP